MRKSISKLLEDWFTEVTIEEVGNVPSIVKSIAHSTTLVSGEACTEEELSELLIELLNNKINLVEGRKCSCGYSLGIQRSAAGHYLGTVDDDGFPNCRISGYYKSTEQAAKLFANDDFEIRDIEKIGECAEAVTCIQKAVLDESL